ncbi:hypothetical protein BDZ97DRAFT_179132 [Flammula alnicola]|nr:hypothetical protein BDZ97DRAFT_1426534 [Flammula alnicola]KAF8970006.1 hypothetical protein BDZ97DRAFT_179132 [Flammula alnicola]
MQVLCVMPQACWPCPDPSVRLKHGPSRYGFPSTTLNQPKPTTVGNTTHPCSSRHAPAYPLLLESELHKSSMLLYPSKHNLPPSLHTTVG